MWSSGYATLPSLPPPTSRVVTPTTFFDHAFGSWLWTRVVWSSYPGLAYRGPPSDLMADKLCPHSSCRSSSLLPRHGRESPTDPRPCVALDCDVWRVHQIRLGQAENSEVSSRGKLLSLEVVTLTQATAETAENKDTGQHSDREKRAKIV